MQVLTCPSSADCPSLPTRPLIAASTHLLLFCSTSLLRCFFPSVSRILPLHPNLNCPLGACRSALLSGRKSVKSGRRRGAQVIGGEVSHKGGVGKPTIHANWPLSSKGGDSRVSEGDHNQA
ncbi:unnamed protein product [Protopolystoma xenopodis]|uniref:Uncharacterized protein n=1 Tax=Protopolystoma xenopodis TaxID=117903 RepID=A0A3S5CJ28_9PLAT|nr:unnamed protein product [Protopolystoma xenopodis]